VTQIFFEVFTPIPTLNKLLHMCWQAKKRLQDKLNLELGAFVLSQNPGEIPPGFRGAKKKRVLQITLHRKKLQDPDNLVGSCKPLIDAIKKAGLIYDDSSEWITLKVNQIQAKAETIFVEVRGQ